MKQLSIQMNVGLEADTGRAVQLAHHDALCAVDHEGSGLGHERNLSHVDLLFLGGLFVLITESDVERGAVGLTLDLAFERTDLRLLQMIAYEIERGLLFKTIDREELTEDSLKAHVLTLGGLDARLEKFLVGLDLQFDEVGRLDGLVKFAEVDSFRHGAGSWVALG
jgi:hypothetical protein